MTIIALLISTLLTVSERATLDNASIQGLKPGISVVRLLPRVLFGKTESTQYGWRFTGSNYIVTVHSSRPYVISSVVGYGSSWLAVNGIPETSPERDVQDFFSVARSLDWAPLQGEPGRFYWKPEDDVYLRIRTQPKSTKIHEVALFDASSLESLALRRPTFLNSMSDNSISRTR